MRDEFRCFRAEIKKYILEFLCYYPDHIVGIAILLIVFLGFFTIKANGTAIMDPSYYIGFVYWYYANSIIGEASMSISDEKQSGTFEQLLIKPTHLSSILFWRTICWLIIQTVEVVMVLMIIKIIFHTPMGFTIEIIPIFVVTMMGLMGLSFLLSSLTLLYTKTASFDAIIGYILLFFTGIISGDVTNKGISYYVLPLSQGIQLSREFINNKQVDLGQFAFLLVNTLVYLLIGFLLFKYAMKKGRKSGVSSEY